MYCLKKICFSGMMKKDQDWLVHQDGSFNTHPFLYHLRHFVSYGKCHKMSKNAIECWFFKLEQYLLHRKQDPFMSWYYKALLESNFYNYVSLTIVCVVQIQPASICVRGWDEVWSQIGSTPFSACHIILCCVNRHVFFLL